MMQIFLENMVELVVSAPLLNLVWIAAAIVISVDVLFFLACVVLATLESLLDSVTVATVLGAMALAATVLILSLMKSGGGAAVTSEEDGSPSRANIETGDMELTASEDGCPAGDAAVDDDEEDGRPITAVEAVHVLLFLVVIGLVLDSLLDSLNWTIIFAMAGYGVAFALVWEIGVAEDDGVENNGDGGPSRADIETGDIEWTVGEDGCSAGDAIETDAPRSVEDDNGRPVTATAEVPFKPRRSPRIAAQTQTRVEPRRSPRLAANRIRANSLLNVSSQPRRSARIAAVRLMRGV